MHPWRWLAIMVALVLAGPALAAEQAMARGDTLGLEVVGESDLTGQYLVGDDGYVSLPLVGRLEAAGRTCSELGGQIKGALSRYLKNPVLTLSIRGHSRRVVSVGGQVRSPGSYELGPATTLLQALGLAGGPLPTANLSQVRLLRGGESTSYDLDRYQRQNDTSQNPILQPGDDVLVEEIHHFFVTGAVQRPGAYLPTPGLTLAEVLAVAGGYTPKADLAGAMLTKASGEKVPVDLSGLARGEVPAGAEIGPGDALFIPTSNTVEVMLLGGFRQTGKLLVPAQTSVVELLALAGGAEPGAKVKEMRILRQQNGKPASLKVDVDGYLKSPTPQRLQAMLLQPGDMVYLPTADPQRRSKWSELGWLTNILVPLLIW